VKTEGKAGAKPAGCPCQCSGICATAKSFSPVEAQPSGNGEPDFTKMTAAQKIAYHKARWDRILG
jgi:hypothetical protein